MINPTQLRRFIDECLLRLGPIVPWSHDARELLMMTLAQESLCGYYHYQVKGPAIGFFNMEIPTHNDIWNNFLTYKPGLAEAVTDFMMKGFTKETSLELCHGYQVVMARMQYWRRREPLPPSTNSRAMADYYKRYYNTSAGDATVESAILKYEDLCFKK